MLGDCHIESNLGFSCSLPALAGKAAADQCVGSPGRANKMRGDSGSLPGTLRVCTQLHTPSGTRLLSILYRLRSTVRGTSTAKAGQTAQAFLTRGFSVSVTRPVMDSVPYLVTLKIFVCFSLRRIRFCLYVCALSVVRGFRVQKRASVPWSWNYT